MNTKLALKLIVLGCLATGLHFSARAQGTAFTYQGRLTDNGTLANGIYDLQFTIYDLASNGNQVGPIRTNTATGVTNGLFTVTLDFGNAFSGADRFLEIAARTNGGGGFVALTPRQPLTASPYAIFAGTASNVVSGSAVKSLNTLKDDITLAAGTNVIITPSGNTLTIASAGAGGSGIWNLNGATTYYNAGSVGIGTNNPALGARLEVNGVTKVDGGGSGGYEYFHTPNGESGMSIIGVNRADLRFDGSSVKLLAGFGAGSMPSANGIAVTTSGTVGIGTTAPAAGAELEVNGPTRIDPGGSGGYISFGPASGETGMAIIGANRADIRFDGSTLKLLAGTGTTPPGGGIFVNTSGNVGMGTVSPAHRLSLIGGPTWTSAGWTGALELGNASAIGWHADAAGQRFGIGQTGGGLYFFRTASDPGTTGSAANYDLKITDNGNLAQTRDKGGAVKAMIYVNADGSIARCYNGITDSSTGGCGFTVTKTGQGDYNVDFGFQVNDRFVSVTPQLAYGTDIGTGFYFSPSNANIVEVATFSTDVDYLNALADNPFMIIVY
jgi:hypothetical protein